ncbi:BACON domain-containing carbohydrate-binding protein [uncultured Prevotella sp.]|uniref:BACON domain-containing protein n=1 Tax=uncultured Prevotella sp. TaxID=159272 RepID=UPI0025D4E551|nr:BACON domain-containing carbohydrate-binding protein [uncultured Prevotella sp.]
MYIKKLTSWFFMLLAVALAACSDVTDIVGGGTQDLPSEGVVLTLKLPNFTKNSVATRAESQQVDKVCVLCYDSDDKYLGMSNITSSDIKPKDDGTYEVKVMVKEGAATLHVVANADITESDAKDAEGKINLYNAVRSDKIDINTPVCWGSIKVADMLSGNLSLSLLRQFAKTSVTKDASLTNFEITGFRLFYTASSGTIASKSINDVALPSVDCSDNTDGYVSGEQPFYETPADKAYMIIRAKYDGGADTYYKVAFKNKTSDGTLESIALLRNHHYQVKVTAVNHSGWSTEQEAKDNLPENRLSVVVVDDNPPIVNMIACKDYELGVCGKQTVLGKEKTATITFVTTKQHPEDFSVVSNNPDWISVPTDYQSKAKYIDLPTSARPHSSAGRLYTIELTLTENYESDAHTGIVTITSGDLSRSVEITQLGYDFRTDPNRIVQIRGLAGLSSDEQADYFKWMDTSLQGITPAENQGRVRNDGLHFFVGNNPVYYLIPKLQGDELTCNDTRVKVDKESDSGFYKVTLADNSPNNYNRWISDEAFTIITITNNRTNITVSYPVYHVGLFAQLTEKAATDYQLGKSKASGWYYYEMVNVVAKVTKKDGTTEYKAYYMLDRNLGATNNGYYSPSTTALKDNIGAIGGYFKISEAQSSDEAKKDDHVVDALAIGNFKVCDNMCLQGLIDNNNALAIEEETTHYGEKYNCLRITTRNRDIPEIFIPMSGYYEGATYKDEYHANLWTSSRLSDYQGFSASSPEYGFWYLYLDVFGKTLNMSNYRFVSGSSGGNTGRYRAMPVRLVAK